MSFANYRVDGVLFDLDDTLIDHQGAVSAAVIQIYREFPDLHSYYLSELDFLNGWNIAHREYYPRYLSGEITHDQQRILRIRSIWKKAGLDLEDTDCIQHSDRFLAHYAENWRIFPDVFRCLESLRGLKLGIVTNGWSQQQRAKLMIENLKDHFDSIVISSEVGCAKPDKRIFEMASAQLGFDPTRTAFVEDLYDLDVLGPVGVGMQAFWLQRDAQPEIREIPPLAKRIASLAELAPALSNGTH